MQQEQSKRLFARFLTGVSVVTCLDPSGRPTGMTASAVTPLGLEPPSLLLCVGVEADVLPDLRRERRFAVHLLHAGQQELVWAFAMDGPDKRARIDELDLPWRQPLGSPPILGDCLARLDCRLARDLDGGDHRILVGRLESGDPGGADGQPMVYFDGRLGGRIDRDSGA